jgi:hypothetical protein
MHEERLASTRCGTLLRATSLPSMKPSFFFVTLLATTCAGLASCFEQPEREVRAIVVSIAEHANPRWSPDELVVTARSQDGAVGTRAVSRARLNCRVGDVAHGSARGLSLTLASGACVRKGS